MSFLSPEYFWLFLFLLAGVFKKEFSSLRFTSYGYIVTFVFIIIALSRPVIEQEPIESEEIFSDVIVAVDLSYSMQGTDIKPSRLKRAKEILTQLVKIKDDSRFGVLGFTTNAIVLSPLTQDSQLLLHLFNALDDKLIITKGSSVMPALKLARKMSKSKNPSVVILSDGADALEYDKEALYAKKSGIRVNIFMLATPYGSTLLLENGELLKDKSGDIVVSMENPNISQISTATGGVYTKDIDELLSALESQENREFKSKTTVVKNFELFYLFIVLAIITFLVSITSLKRYIISFLLLFGIALQANMVESFNTANEQYKAGEYEKALLGYKSLKSNSAEIKAIIYYNMANSLVRLKEFQKAREAYLKSLTLNYSKEADENMRFIKDAGEEKIMKSGKQKSDKKSSIAKKEQGKRNKKEGGGSNMKVSANASDGAGKILKKNESEPMLSLDAFKAKLSSKQYELINKRSVNETKPY